ncbi:putative membrane protein [Arcicella aurantiaca]|uniref:Putative membrane protein n=1 Tax=Arcicella aurantiaca TaxID=591202 RepID=A0A316E2L0_9BACT|nr:carotenoid biosynthesis protein [Arcicella aurantiaca]PWK22973.1 putative membrane protein [Arcicella aurantiaca]
MTLAQIKSSVSERYRTITFTIIVLMYLAGTIGLIYPLTQPYFKLLSPLNLWISLILLLLFHQDFSIKFIFIAVVIFLAGFLVEVIGVHTGIIFGEYRYGKTLGTQLFNVPLVIGANWLLLVYCSSSVTQNICVRLKKIFPTNPLFSFTFFKAFLAASLMVSLDFLIEPVAIRLDFWHWQNEQIPLQNFQAWFLIAFLLTFIFLKANFLKNNLLAPLLFTLQLLFFIFLYLYYSTLGTT